jgi:pimeloyl-ACP methyl ester carboxylesterase
MPTLLSRGVALFCFDFAGCGRSDGEYISLGWHEREDLATVVDYLRASPRFGAIGLWGRSMGAVTALLHADRDPSIGAMVVDSPFTSLRTLIIELAQSGHVMLKVPGWLLSAVLMVVKLRIKALAGFDIDDLAPVNHVGESFIPALFVAARDDTFILPHHTKMLYDAYSGDKELEMIEGDHNTERPLETAERAVNFFCRAFRYDAFADRSVPRVLRTVSPEPTRLTEINFASPVRPSSSRRPALPCLAEERDPWSPVERDPWSPASEGHFPDGSVLA